MAPVLLFAYARPGHLQTAVESLLRNAEACQTPLIVYSDAPKTFHEEPLVDAVRMYAQSIDGFASTSVIERPTNFGLARSIIDGVTEVLSRHDRVIVVEDDLVVSPHFLRYMNQALTLYAEESRVASIHGYTYPTGAKLPETFFQRGADCWGWATWARAWQHFDADGERLLQAIRSCQLTRAFDLNGAYKYSEMLAAQVAGRNNSWAIRWHASCFLKDMLTLYPGRSLVENIGNDGSGTHCEVSENFTQRVSVTPVKVDAIELCESVHAREAFETFFRGQRPTWAARFRKRLGRALASPP